MKSARQPSADVPSNAHLAELLAVEAETARPPLLKALKRASRRALLWPEEASQIVRQGRSVTELSGVGPYLEKRILHWMDDPPPFLPPPDIRAGFLTLTQARAALAGKPGWLRAIKGDLQMHTTWSDGTGSVAEMVEAGAQRDYQYVSITDHSKGLKIAGGINETQLRRQGEEVAEINRARATAGDRIRALHSIELNLNPLGEGDMEEDSLAGLDLVLGCFHSALRKTEDQTKRYLAALRNPAIQILGHPRGRIYNFRLGLRADWHRVFSLAAELDKAVEIDAYPDRQDLSPDLLAIAREEGCRISLGTDSHGPSQLGFIEFGAAAALLAGIRRERILNFLPRDELLAWAGSLRGC